MTKNQKFLPSCVAGSISLLAFAVAFSACVPTEPTTPAVTTRLNFVVDSADGSTAMLKSWDATTGQVTDIISGSNSVGVIFGAVSGQPNGNAVLYLTGGATPLGALGAYNTVAENSAGQYVKRYIKPRREEELEPPVWSPDGAHLAWVQSDILRVAVVGKAAKQMGSSTGGVNWSPDGSKLIYSKGTDGITVAVHVYDVTTGQDTLLIDAVEISAKYGVRFTWLPDNRHVVISSVRHAVIDITAPTPVAPEDIGENKGDVIPSPAGSSFVLVDGEPFPYATRTYTLAFSDGRAPMPLPDAFTKTAPSWSASGDRLYVVTDAGADGILDIVTRNADGQIQQTIVTGMPALRPGYGDSYTNVYNSPKNEKLAFIYRHADNDTLRLTVIDVPSGDIHSFDPISDSFTDASWSPNGRYLAWGGIEDDQFLYDSNSADTTSKLINIDENQLGLRLGPWSQDSKHISACRPAGHLLKCLVTVITVTNGDLTYTAIPEIADDGLVWTGKK